MLELRCSFVPLWLSKSVVWPFNAGFIEKSGFFSIQLLKTCSNDGRFLKSKTPLLNIHRSFSLVTSQTWHFPSKMYSLINTVRLTQLCISGMVIYPLWRSLGGSTRSPRSLWYLCQAWAKEHPHQWGCLLEAQGEVLKSNYGGLEPTQGEPLCCGPFSVPLLCRKVLLWHGIQRPPGALPRCELGEEQRPWGNGSPDMGGIPPTSSLLPRLLRWTKPSKEGSVTEARALQRPVFKRGFGLYLRVAASRKERSLTCKAPFPVEQGDAFSTPGRQYLQQWI